MAHTIVNKLILDDRNKRQREIRGRDINRIRCVWRERVALGQPSLPTGSHMCRAYVEIFNAEKMCGGRKKETKKKNCMC